MIKKFFGALLSALLVLLVEIPALAQVYTGTVYRSRLVSDTSAVTIPTGYGAMYYEPTTGVLWLKDEIGWYNPRNSIAPGDFLESGITNTFVGNTTFALTGSYFLEFTTGGGSHYSLSAAGHYFDGHQFGLAGNFFTTGGHPLTFNTSGSTALQLPTTGTVATEAYADAKVVDAINNGVTSSAPSQNAVFDALATKQPLDAGLTSLAAIDVVGNAGAVPQVDVSGVYQPVELFDNPCTDPGCLLKFNGTTIVALDPGADGEVLTVSGGGTDVGYAAATSSSAGVDGDLQFADNIGGFATNDITKGGAGELYFIDTGVAALQLGKTGNIFTLGRNLTLSGSDNNIGNGYDAVINGGDALDNDDNGGDVLITVGSGFGAGVVGKLFIDDGLTPSDNDVLTYHIADGSATWEAGGGGGGSGTVTNIATTAPLSGGPITTTGTLSITDAAADGSTKGAASFTAADFDASSGNISLDYTNGQAASGSNKGFLTSADWTTFNGKLGTGLARLLTGANTFSGAVEDVGSSTNTYTYTANSLGAYSTPVGLLYRNTAAAAAGAQQFSPATIKESRGWRTGSGGASETILFSEFDIPIQGTNNPSVSRSWRTSIDGSAQFAAMTLNVNETNSSATLTVNGPISGGAISGSSGTYSGNITSSAAGSFTQKVTTGGFVPGIAIKTISYALTSNDHTILADATAGSMSVTAPAASTLSGSDFTVKKIDATANTVTVDPNASETIDGATTLVLHDQNDYVVFQGDGTGFRITALRTGQEISAIQSTYTNFTTTATYQNITSITLPQGDWDLSAFFTYSSNSATITAASNAIFVVSTTTASAAGATEGRNIAYVPQAALLGTSLFSEAISPYRVSVAAGSTTTYYLNAQATFTLGNPQFVGGLRATRLR